MNPVATFFSFLPNHAKIEAKEGTIVQARASLKKAREEKDNFGLV